MLNKLDGTQLGNYVALVGFVLGLLKLNISTEEVGQALSATLVLVGLGTSIYRRYKDGNLTLGGLRKE